MSKDVTLPSGVKVRLTSVPSMIVLAVSQSLPTPKVPIWHNPDKDRDEPNPIDPDYIEAVKRHGEQLGQLTTAAYLANGVKVLEVPEDKYPLDSDEWIERLEILGIAPRVSGIGRYIDWLQWHVLGDTDITDIITGIAVLNGTISEAQVEQAAESFRPNQNGPALAIVPTQADVRLGDTPVSDTWPSN